MFQKVFDKGSLGDINIITKISLYDLRSLLLLALFCNTYLGNLVLYMFSLSFFSYSFYLVQLLLVSFLWFVVYFQLLKFLVYLFILFFLSILLKLNLFSLLTFSLMSLFVLKVFKRPSVCSYLESFLSLYHFDLVQYNDLHLHNDYEEKCTLNQAINTT